MQRETNLAYIHCEKLLDFAKVGKQEWVAAADAGVVASMEAVEGWALNTAGIEVGAPAELEGEGQRVVAELVPVGIVVVCIAGECFVVLGIEEADGNIVQEKRAVVHWSEVVGEIAWEGIGAGFARGPVVECSPLRSNKVGFAQRSG